MHYLHDRSCLGLPNHRIRRHYTSRAPCHRLATVPTQLWRNSSLYREEQSRSPAARCDARQARRAPTQPAPAALRPTKNRPESSTKTNRCSQPRQATSRLLTESRNSRELDAETRSTWTASATMIRLAFLALGLTVFRLDQ